MMKTDFGVSDQSNAKKGTVLIVDDEAANLGVLFEHLGQADFKVLIAEDGESALRGLSRVTPDIALLDVNLPDMDGFELCRRLKERYGNDIPVIFLTSLTDIQHRLRGLDLDAADYITKPFYPDEVVAHVKKHLMLRNLQKSLEEKNIQLEQEIAERKQAEEALRESEEQFRRMFENHNAVMLLIEPETGKIIRANHSAQKYYGYTADEFENLTVYQINQLSKEEIVSEMRNAEAEKRSYFHFLHKVASGEIRDVEVHSSPISFKGKTLLFSVIHDITQRTRAEDELNNQMKFSESLMNAIPSPVFYKDVFGKYIGCNSAFETFTGKQREEVIGKTVYETAPAEIAAKYEEKDLDLFRNPGKQMYYILLLIQIELYSIQ